MSYINASDQDRLTSLAPCSLTTIHLGFNLLKPAHDLDQDFETHDLYPSLTGPIHVPPRLKGNVHTRSSAETKQTSSPDIAYHVIILTPTTRVDDPFM